MAAAAKQPQPLFLDGPLPAPTTPGDQLLAAILGELCAIREILMATAPPAISVGSDAQISEAVKRELDKAKPRRR